MPKNKTNTNTIFWGSGIYAFVLEFFILKFLKFCLFNDDDIDTVFSYISRERDKKRRAIKKKINANGKDFFSPSTSNRD